MVDSEFEKITKERFLELPVVIQDIITKSDWLETVRKISKENNLRIDQGGDLEREVLFVMLGFETSENFFNNLLNEVELEPQIATKISKEVSEKIFYKIKEKIIEKTNRTDKPEELDRENLLKEIEDVDKKEMPSVEMSSVSPTTKIAEQKPKDSALQNAVVQKSEIIKIDPYREPVK